MVPQCLTLIEHSIVQRVTGFMDIFLLEAGQVRKCSLDITHNNVSHIRLSCVGGIGWKFRRRRHPLAELVVRLSHSHRWLEVGDRPKEKQLSELHRRHPLAELMVRLSHSHRWLEVGDRPKEKQFRVASPSSIGGADGEA